MVASDGLALQVTLVVKFCVVLLLYVPVAANCCVCPTAIEAAEGVTAMDVKVTGAAAVTVSVTAGLLTPPADAVMLTEPAATPFARPPLMLASRVFEDVQAAVLVRFCVLPLL
jgi:hypothetical protein